MYISNKDVINAVAGVIYAMHPYHNPENINDIIEAIEKAWKERVPEKEKKHTFKLINFEEWVELKAFLHEILWNVEAFKQLNISRKLKDLGVKDADDKRNQGFRFTDRHSVDTEDGRYTDFIDLDACLQNVIRQISVLKESDEDCFLCKYAESYGSMKPGDERCANCLCNPQIKFLREPHPMSLKPRKDWTQEEIEKYDLH